MTRGRATNLENQQDKAGASSATAGSPNNTAPAPIHTLPDELLQRVFAHLARWSVHPLIHLQLVCKRWKAALDGPSEAWENISFYALLRKDRGSTAGPFGIIAVDRRLLPWLLPKLSAARQVSLFSNCLKGPGCMPKGWRCWTWDLDQWRQLLSGLRSVERLESLQLCRKQASPTLKLACRLTTLTSLTLLLNCQPADVAAGMQHLSCLTNMAVLGLSGTAAGGPGSEYWWPTLPRLPSVNVLVLNGYGAGCTAMLQQLPALQFLRVETDGETPTSVDFSESLQRLTTLTIINVEGANMAPLIIPVSCFPTSLQQLAVSCGNPPSSLHRNADFPAAALSSLTRLTALALSGVAFPHLLPAVAALPLLRELYVDEHLADQCGGVVVPSLPSLRKLSFSTMNGAPHIRLHLTLPFHESLQLKGWDVPRAILSSDTGEPRMDYRYGQGITVQGAVRDV